MVTIKNAWIKAGYSGEDHLNTDGPVQGIIGRSFRSVAEARRAAVKAAQRGNATGSPIGLDVILPDGSTVTV